MEHDAAFGWSGPRPQAPVRPPRWRVGAPTFAADQFDRPRRASPWAGHRWFAYDLVGYLRPRRIVELGTHYACSFWSFCEAAADFELPTELVAVDTWEGDPHAGFYDGVYELVEGWRGHYPTVRTRLLRSTFDDAVTAFEPGTIDLLHIDGFHSYEAVAHDHSTWADRLTPDGTVLFHDVDPATGYGSARYWSELCERQGGWTFTHSFGLGVTTRHAGLSALLASDEFAQIAHVYPARAAADLAAMQVEDLAVMAQERQALIERQDFLIADRDQALAAQAALIDAKQAIIDHQDFLIADRDQALAAQAALIDAKQAIIEQQGRLLSGSQPPVPSRTEP